MSNEKSLFLDNAQEEIFLEHEHLISITINKIIDYKKLDSVIDKDDLMQYGRLALIRAIQTFKEGNFRAYAITVIRNALMTEINKNHDPIGATAIRLVHTKKDEETIEVLDIEDEKSTITDSVFIIEMLLVESRKRQGIIRNGIICYAELASGYSVTDIAKHHHVSAETVASWMSYARIILFKSDRLRSALGLELYKTNMHYPKPKMRNK